MPLVSIKEGEALAMLEGLKWLQELELDHVIFELDCKFMVD